MISKKHSRRKIKKTQKPPEISKKLSQKLRVQQWFPERNRDARIGRAW
jgi:hypothetical protein